VRYGAAVVLTVQLVQTSLKNGQFQFDFTGNTATNHIQRFFPAR
jgi:hypothetical protein